VETVVWDTLKYKNKDLRGSVGDKKRMCFSKMLLPAVLFCFWRLRFEFNCGIIIKSSFREKA